MSFIEKCRQFIAIDSTPLASSSEAARYAAQMAEEAGLSVELQEENISGVQQYNFIARSHPEIERNKLLLQTHLDTTDPGAYPFWTKTDSNPFKASIHEDAIYGLGAADAKLDLLCKLEAVQKLKNSSFVHPLTIVGTFGTEDGMAGAVKLIRRKKVKADCVLVGEPTSLGLVNEGIGVIHVEISVPFSADEVRYRERHDLMESSSSQSKMFYGKAAHSSDPKLGENAIVKMLDYLAKLPEGLAVMDMEGGHSQYSVPSSAVLEIDMVGSLKETVVTKLKSIVGGLKKIEEDFVNYSSLGFSPSTPTMNIGVIKTIKDCIRLNGICRVPPCVSENAYSEWMNSMRSVCEEQNSVFRVVEYKPAFSSSPDSDFVKGCQQVLEDQNLESGLNKFSTVTEASVFHKLGMECLLFGPGQGVGNSHAPNESVKIEELEKAISFYTKTLERFCL